MVKNYRLWFLGILLIVLMSIVVISHLTPNNDNSKVFENQFIKFNYSSNLNVVDYSNNTALLVVVYDGDVYPSNWEVNAIGTIRVTKDSIYDLNMASTQIKFKNLNISGHKALVAYNHLNSAAFIYLNDSAELSIILNPGHDSYVNTILNSFVIKEVPPQFTILNKTTN